MTEHLDRIYKLGFLVTLNWNEEFEIYYNFNDDMPGTILRCYYYKSKTNPHSFEEMIEVCCDLFYTWYNKNLQSIKDFDNTYNQESISNLEDICLGDVSKIVARELNLGDILGLIDGDTE